MLQRAMSTILCCPIPSSACELPTRALYRHKEFPLSLKKVEAFFRFLGECINVLGPGEGLHPVTE